MRHLPVPVPMAKEGKERKFTGRVYLNALGTIDSTASGITRVRAELRSGNRPVPIPQEGLEQAGIRVESEAPLREQRLHVLMLGVEVPEAERKPLVRNVIQAVGGAIPEGSPNFTEGRFEHPRFKFAYLYSPRLGYTKSGDLNALLNAARTDIERRSKRAGEEWVNDVIVVYYQGEDWLDQSSNRRLLHSATTLSGAAGKNMAEYAIRIDNLPQVPGLPVALVNVVGDEEQTLSLAVDIPYLRYAWKTGEATGELLTQLASAVKAERTIGKVVAFVDAGLRRESAPQLTSKPPPLAEKSEVAPREISKAKTTP